MSTAAPTVNLVDIYTSAKVGCPYNEDQMGLFITRNAAAAWVLDGATGFDPGVRLVDSGGSDAAWYANNLNQIFTSNIRAGFPPDGKQEDFYRHALTRARESFNTNSRLPADKVERCLLPSAAGILMNYHQETRLLTFSGLGDCIAIIKVEGENHAFTTTPSFFAESQKRETMMKAGQYSKDDRRMLRNRMNSDEGYWIMSVHPEAADHISVEHFQIPEGKTVYVALMSDGLERASKLLHLDHTGLINLILDSSIGEVTHMIREKQREMGPAQLKQMGYSKANDDITGMLLDFTP